MTRTQTETESGKTIAAVPPEKDAAAKAIVDAAFAVHSNLGPAGLQLDFVVNERVVVEVKAVDAMIPVFQAQVLTYLELTGHRLGLLINSNVPVIQAGIRRLAL